MLRRFAALLLIFMLIFSSAWAQEAKNIASQCAFRVSEGTTEKITDNSTGTGWVPSGANPEMMIRLPDSGASAFQLTWYKPAVNFEIIQYDAAQNVLSTTRTCFSSS
jgi:hypothetical protein